MYNPKYYINGELWQLAGPKSPAIRTFTFGEELVIGVFQGSNEPYPEIDIKIRVLLPGELAKPFLIPHESWALELLRPSIIKKRLSASWMTILSFMTIANLFLRRKKGIHTN